MCGRGKLYEKKLERIYYVQNGEIVNNEID
jgi:hypothetical protein